MNNLFDKVKNHANNKKNVLYIILLLLLSFIFIFFILFSSPDKSQVALNNKSIEVSVPLNQELLEENWKDQYEEKQKKIKDDTQGLQAKIDNLTKQLQASQEKAIKDQEIAKQQVQEQLAWAVKEIQESKNDRQAVNIKREKRIKKHDLHLLNPLNEKSKAPITTFENTIPLGSFGKAIMKHGIAASTAVSAQSNPLPIVFEFLEDLSLPQSYRKDLKKCRVTAGAYGDLSSERIYIRLDQLSCINENTGEIVETDLVGYVSDGYVGVAGEVVAKDAKFLQNSLVGGIFSGLGKTVGQSGVLVSPLFSANGQISQPPVGDRFKSGISDGASTAIDKVSQYYLDQAELLHPVILVKPGRIVDLVLSKSATIGSNTAKKTVAEERDSAKREALRIKQQREGGR